MTNLADLYISGQYNITRLHNVVTLINNEAQWFPRQIGKTFATLMLMLGEFEIGDRGNNYLYLGENPNQVKYVKTCFKRIIEFRNQGNNSLKPIESEHKLFVGNNNHLVQSYLFLPVNEQVARWSRGTRIVRIFYDASPLIMNQFSYEIQLVKECSKWV